MKLSILMGGVLGFVLGVGSWARANCNNTVSLTLIKVTKNSVDEPLPTERLGSVWNAPNTTYDRLYDPTTETFVWMEHRP